MIKTIIKRDGRKVDFDLEKIAQAIFSAAQAMGGDNYDQARTLAEKVEALLESSGLEAPTVEQVQNVIESWEITAQQGGHQARFLLTDPSVAENVIAYACWGDGKWQQLTFHQNGSYLVFPMEAEYMQIALVQEVKDITLWYIAGAAALAVLVIVTVVIIRKKRHSQSNTAENTEA